MSYAKEMLENSPGAVPVDAGLVTEAIDALFACEQACVACADACIGEKDSAMLVACIRLDLACAEVCGAAGRIISRELAGDPGMGPTVLEASVKACGISATECEKHAGDMEHCRLCAEVCRRAEEAAKNLLEALTA